MPLVITKSGAVHWVPSEEVLAELLGHSDFDGEEWAVGDRLIFEDGTESRIREEPGHRFHSWEEPTAADLEEVKRAAGVADARDWDALFAARASH
jgi:hypothetical protein